MKELTDIHPPELAARMKLTRGGQAHWAVDFTRTCRECRHWAPRTKNIKKRRCAKAAVFAASATPLVPHNAFACKYFEAAENPPDVHEPDADAEND